MSANAAPRYRIVQATPDFYEIEDDTRRWKVARWGLDQETDAKIRAFAENEESEKQEPAGEEEDEPPHFAGGGMADVDAEALEREKWRATHPGDLPADYQGPGLFPFDPTRGLPPEPQPTDVPREEPLPPAGHYLDLEPQPTDVPREEPLPPAGHYLDPEPQPTDVPREEPLPPMGQIAPERLSETYTLSPEEQRAFDAEAARQAPGDLFQNGYVVPTTPEEQATSDASESVPFRGMEMVAPEEVSSQPIELVPPEQVSSQVLQSRQPSATEPVPTDEQLAAAFQALLHGSSKQTDGAGGIGGGGRAPGLPPMSAEDKAAIEAAKAAGVAANEQARRDAETYNGYYKQAVTREAHWNRIIEGNQRRIDSLRADIADDRMDPNRLWNSMSTGQHIGAMIGVFLGGIGLRGGEPNAVLGVVQRAIDRDIEAQRLEMSEKHTLLGSYIQQGHDYLQAKQMARADALDIVAAQLERSARIAGGPKALAAAAQAVQEITARSADMRMKAASFTAEMDLLPLRRQMLMTDIAAKQAAQRQAEMSIRLGGMTPGQALEQRVWDEFNKGPLAGPMVGALKARVTERARRSGMGFVEIPGIGTGLANSMPGATAVANFISGKENFQNLIGQLESFVQKNPHGGWPGFQGDERSTAEAVYMQLLRAMNADIPGGFGAAFTAHEREIIEKQLADWSKVFSLGSWKQAKLDAVKEMLDAKYRGLLRANVAGMGAWGAEPGSFDAIAQKYDKQSRSRP